MHTEQLSSSEFYQSSYLAKLQQAVQTFVIDADYKVSTVSAEAMSNKQDPHSLIVSCGALNLEKLLAVQTSLSKQLAVVGWQISESRSNSAQWVAKASVNLLTDQQQALQTAISETAQQQQVELAVVQQAPTFATPGLLVLDMDSTVIQVECIDEIAKLAGVGEQVANVTELAMQGKLDFSASLNQRVACLEGIEESLLRAIRDRLPLMPGIERLVHVLQSQGWKVAIASGGFTYFANYLQQRLNLDAAVSNTLDIVDGKLTGQVTGQIVDAQVKATTLENLAAQFDIPMSQTVAMGDGANDLTMMNVAQLGVAFKAKPIVSAQAQTSIRFAGLDTMLDYLA